MPGRLLRAERLPQRQRRCLRRAGGLGGRELRLGVPAELDAGQERKFFGGRHPRFPVPRRHVAERERDGHPAFCDHEHGSGPGPEHDIHDIHCCIPNQQRRRLGRRGGGFGGRGVVDHDCDAGYGDGRRRFGAVDRDGNTATCEKQRGRDPADGAESDSDPRRELR